MGAFEMRSRTSSVASLGDLSDEHFPSVLETATWPEARFVREFSDDRVLVLSVSSSEHTSFHVPAEVEDEYPETAQTCSKQRRDGLLVLDDDAAIATRMMPTRINFFRQISESFGVYRKTLA